MATHSSILAWRFPRTEGAWLFVSRADRGIGGVRHVAPPTWLLSNFPVLERHPQLSLATRGEDWVTELPSHRVTQKGFDRYCQISFFKVCRDTQPLQQQTDRCVSLEAVGTSQRGCTRSPVHEAPASTAARTHLCTRLLVYTCPPSVLGSTTQALFCH